MALVSVRRVSKSYRDKGESYDVLKDVSFDLEGGLLYSLCGPSGSGKTTLLNVISGLDKPDTGEVFLEGERLDDLNEASKAKLRRISVGLVFQNPNLVAHLTVLENVILPTLFWKNRSEDSKTLGISLLERLGMKEKIAKLPSKLSEGERRRVSVARSLITKPKIVLADEPTINLDAKNSDAVLELLKESVESGASTLISTHDENIARSSDSILRISFGKVSSS